MSCNCFLQRYVQCHLWSCAISTEWRLKHFMKNSIPVLNDGIRNTVFYSVTDRKPVYFSKVRSIWDLDMRFEVLTQKVPKHKFRILKVFDNFKNKQKSVWSKFFLICRSMYILKVYSCWETWAGRGSEWSRITTIIETLK